MGRPVFLVTAAALFLFVGVAGAASIRGTRHADLLRGGPGADRIDAGRGNDRITVFGGGRDRVECGPGVDLVNADSSDRLSRTCERAARVIARDPFSRPAQHSTIAEPDSYAVGRTVVVAYQAGRFPDGGALNTGWATSKDGGQTWRSGTLPSLTVAARPAGRWQRASDPVVAHDAVHGTWLIASLALSPDSAAVVVSRSTDGLAWGAPVTVVEAPSRPSLMLDKEWIVCDSWAASPHRGTCYVTYSDFRSRRLEFQRSTDGGLTWGPQVSAPENAGRRSILGRWAPAPQPVVQSDGDLVVPYYDEDRMAAVRSADAGRSFSAPVTIAGTRFKATPGLRAPPLPSAEVDRDGVVYVSWPDCGAACERDDLLVARSADGVSWSTTRLRLGSSGDFVIPGLAADRERAGRLALTYYQHKPGGSRDGGRRWGVPRRLSVRSMQLDWIAQAGGAMVGDYISTSFVAGDRVVPVFVLASPPGSRFDQPLFAARLQP
jgi:RTX calcium-binding nonapeptide repeat (4 copies)